MFESQQKILIHFLGLGAQLRFQPFALFEGIVQFRVAGGNFLAANDQLEHVYDTIIIRADFGQRHKVPRQARHKGRILKRALDKFFINLVRGLDHGPGRVNYQTQTGRTRTGRGRREVIPIRTSLFQDQIAIGDFTPGRSKVNPVFIPAHLQAADDLLRHGGDHFLHERLHAPAV